MKLQWLFVKWFVFLECFLTKGQYLSCLVTVIDFWNTFFQILTFHFEFGVLSLCARSSRSIFVLFSSSFSFLFLYVLSLCPIQWMLTRLEPILVFVSQFTPAVGNFNSYFYYFLVFTWSFSRCIAWILLFMWMCFHIFQFLYRTHIHKYID